MRSATWLALAAMLGFGAAADANDKPEGGGEKVRAGGQHATERSTSEAPPAPRAQEHAQPHVRQEERSSAEPSKGSATPTGAELRHPRAGTGHGDRDREWRYGYHDYRPYNRYRYGYWDSDAYWAPYYYGYGYGYGSGYGSYGYPRYSRYTREAGALRLKVEPESTQVFVDGYYAGVVDDFDGVFQRLYLSPGRHRITLRLEGHRSHVFGIYVPIDQTLKLHHRMVAGDGEDRADFDDRDDRGAQAREASSARSAVAEPSLESEKWGSLRVDVQPVDASVYVDGEFRGTARELRSLKLPAGMHKIEIVRPGFRTVEKDAEVQPDEVAEVTTELEKN